MPFDRLFSDNNVVVVIAARRPVARSNHGPSDRFIGRSPPRPLSLSLSVSSQRDNDIVSPDSCSKFIEKVFLRFLFLLSLPCAVSVSLSLSANCQKFIDMLKLLLACPIKILTAQFFAIE